MWNGYFEEMWERAWVELSVWKLFDIAEAEAEIFGVNLETVKLVLQEVYEARRKIIQDDHKPRNTHQKTKTYVRKS